MLPKLTIMTSAKRTIDETFAVAIFVASPFLDMSLLPMPGLRNRFALGYGKKCASRCLRYPEVINPLLHQP